MQSPTHVAIRPPEDPRHRVPVRQADVARSESPDAFDVEAAATWWESAVPRSLRLLWFHDGGELTDDDRARILGELFPVGRRAAHHTRRFAVLMIAAVLIAVMGLLADSTAVVIGAMLVAPLMRPVLAGAAAVVMGWPGRVARSITTTALASAGAVALAAVTAWIFPGDLDPLPAEVVARTSPNLLDLGVAIAAGAVGAYSRLRRSASDAITGVAVAVALVPPLAVIGITIRLFAWDLALGATMLFLANVVGIMCAAALTFLVCGLPRRSDLVRRSVPIVGGLRWTFMAALMMLLPLHLMRSSLLPAVDATEDVTAVVTEMLGDAESEVMSVAVDQSGRRMVIDVVATPSARLPDADTIADRLAEELDGDVSVDLQVVDVERETGSADADGDGVGEPGGE